MNDETAMPNGRGNTRRRSEFDIAVQLVIGDWSLVIPAPKHGT